jgi:hypothetical protein
MAELKIVLYVLVLIISIINIISSKSKKRKIKSDAKSGRLQLTAKRTLTAAEKNSIFELYKIKPSMLTNESVYEINGAYTESSLEVNSSTAESIHCIDTYEVVWIAQLQNYLSGSNTADVVFLSNDKAAIVSLNEEFDVVEENRIAQCLSGDDGGPGLIQATGTRFNKTRPISRGEEIFLSRDYRVIAVLGVFGSLLLLGLCQVEIWSWIGVAVLLISLWLLLASPYPLASGKNEKLISITGNLACTLSEGNIIAYNIDRFSLFFPQHWCDGLQIGETITVEGYPANKAATSLTVLSVNKNKSVQAEMDMAPYRWPNKYYLLAPAVVIAFLILLTMGGVIDGLNRFNQILATKDAQQEFGGFAEVKNVGLMDGQELSLKNAVVFPRYAVDSGERFSELRQYAGLLLAGIPESKPDFSEVYSRIDALTEFQHTEMVISLEGAKLSDFDRHMFLLRNINKINKKEPADFSEAFVGNPTYDAVLREWERIVRMIDAGTEKIDVQDLLDELDRFFSSEAGILGSRIQQAVGDVVAGVDSVEINTYSSNDVRLSASSLKVFEYVRSYGYQQQAGEVQYREKIPAADTIKDFENSFLKYYEPVELNGTVHGIHSEDGKMTAFYINYDESYGELKDYYFLVSTFLVSLFLFLFATGAAIFGFRKMKARESLLKGFPG